MGKKDFVIDVDDHFVVRKQCPEIGECINLSARINKVVENSTQKYESNPSADIQFCHGMYEDTTFRFFHSFNGLFALLSV